MIKVDRLISPRSKFHSFGASSEKEFFQVASCLASDGGALESEPVMMAEVL